jgi:hypothetical protein
MGRKLICAAVSCVTLALSGCDNLGVQPNEPPDEPPDEPGKSWLAGDHHIHSRYSAEYDGSVDPPKPIIGGDSHYSTVLNAQMGYQHGLSWMVTTDHGGPNHSKLNREQAYPELVNSRQEVSGIIQFYGMELDTPGAKHSTLIIPHTHDEADRLYQLEHSFAWKDAYPEDLGRHTEERMLEALSAMQALPEKPLVFVNHPGRSATDLGVYTTVTPQELRNWNDVAPTIAVGMEGAPGHQAATLDRDGSIRADRERGDYDGYPSMGGFDQMTARVGGFWDSMLGEGRRWWITASSDSHIRYSEGGKDFWPGEFSKTYVFAEKSYDDILHGLRNGHVFVTTGDLISELYVVAETLDGEQSSSIGGNLQVESGSTVRVTVRFLDPNGLNSHHDNPSVARLDLIGGHVSGPVTDRTEDTNSTTRVLKRFAPESWTQDGEYRVVTYELTNVKADSYLRVRGTNGAELEPLVDPLGEDPWSDLWFYSNPIFVSVN